MTTLRTRFGPFALLIALITMLCAKASHATVSLNFTDNDSTPTFASASPGGNFLFSVRLGETLAGEQVSGVDYQIHASTSGIFEFFSRNSQVSGSLFTSPSGFNDAQLTPVILNPNNGTDLGTSTASGMGAPGPGNYELADFSFKVLPTAPTGVYTLSFVSTSNAGPPPTYNTGTFNTLGTFTVSVAVPEPGSMALLAILSLTFGLRPCRH